MERKPSSYLRREAFKDASMIIIGYEGQKTEPKYFKRLEQNMLEPRKAFIHPLPPINGESAPKKVLERVKAFVNDPKRGVNIEAKDNIWFVLDVDRYPIEQYEQVNTFCAENKQRNLAMSNPCFEIWLWMHFEEAKKVTSTKPKDLKYELHLKSVSLNFNGDYTPFVEQAITRAKESDKTSNYFPVEKSSKVYLLVEELLKHRK